LFVIARNSTFTYKGKPVKVKQVSEELGVRYVMEDNNLARRIAEEVIAMCPEVPMAYYLMAYVHGWDYWLGNTPRESIDKAMEMLQKALALDDTYAEAHGLLSNIYFLRREYDKSIAAGERAVALSPSGATAIAYYATDLHFAGRSEEAIPLFQKAIRLNPFGPNFYYNNFGIALIAAGRYEEAVSAYKKLIQRAPNSIGSHMYLAAAYIMMGREKEARAEAAEVFRLSPKFSLETWKKRRDSRTPVFQDQSVRDTFDDALRKAGLKCSFGIVVRPGKGRGIMASKPILPGMSQGCFNYRIECGLWLP
jgi:adenylate cyclase